MQIDSAFHRGARRHSARRLTHAEVEVMEPWLMRGIVINEGDGGLRVAVPVALFPGDACLVRVHGGDGDPTVASTRVAWSRETAGEWIVGLEFVGIDESRPSGSRGEAPRATRRLGSVCAVDIR
jgi:hypothetical protein